MYNNVLALASGSLLLLYMVFEEEKSENNKDGFRYENIVTDHNSENLGSSWSGLTIKPVDSIQKDQTVLRSSE